MIRFFVGRLAQSIAALLVFSVAIFFMSRLTGDPREVLLPISATPEQYARLGAALGLDQPIYVQYAIFVRNALHGDIGNSYSSGATVASLLGQRTTASAQLAASAMVLTFLVGIPLGVLAAVSRGSAFDTAARLVALIGQSAPAFWVGIILIVVFAGLLRWLPAGTNQGPTSIILPAVTLALAGIAGVTRLLRSSMLESLDSEYVKLARIKGLSERAVVWKHALRNSLLSVVSFSGIYFVTLVTQTVAVEVVFAWPGVGQLTYIAILARDFPVIQGVVLLAGVLTISFNLMTDVLYSYIDPRIRLGAA